MRVLNYGGGRQTVAICLLIVRGVIERPDRIVMADTGRENPMTWDYLAEFVQPLLATVDLSVEIAGRELAKVDLYAHNGDLIVPAFTETGKLSAFCSGEWKRDVVERYLRQEGISRGVTLIGFSYDESKRWKRSLGKERHNWTVSCPLVDIMVSTDDCLEIIRRQGWPEPHRSSCWFCPHKSNAEWQHIRDNYPGEWQQAIAIDNEIRENDERGGVWLHHSRVPLADADLTIVETKEKERQCSLGMCFV